MKRTITLSFDEEFSANEHVDSAVGWMARWGIDSERYVNVQIFGDNKGDLHANYRDAAGKLNFHLFGLRDNKDGKYSFHS